MIVSTYMNAHPGWGKMCTLDRPDEPLWLRGQTAAPVDTGTNSSLQLALAALHVALFVFVLIIIN